MPDQQDGRGVQWPFCQEPREEVVGPDMLEQQGLGIPSAGHGRPRAGPCIVLSSREDVPQVGQILGTQGGGNRPCAPPMRHHTLGAVKGFPNGDDAWKLGKHGHEPGAASPWGTEDVEVSLQFPPSLSKHQRCCMGIEDLSQRHGGEGTGGLPLGCELDDAPFCFFQTSRRFRLDAGRQDSGRSRRFWPCLVGRPSRGAGGLWPI